MNTKQQQEANRVIAEMMGVEQTNSLSPAGGDPEVFWEHNRIIYGGWFDIFTSAECREVARNWWLSQDGLRYVRMSANGCKYMSVFPFGLSNSDDYVEHEGKTEAECLCTVAGVD